MTKCPRCFVVLPLDRYRWSTAPRNDAAWNDPVAEAFSGGRVRSGAFYDWPPRPGMVGAPPPSVLAEAREKLGGNVFEVCPTCHFPLPDGWRNGQSICIAMAGARATGKSLYIAVLVKQLQLLCENIGISMEPATRATATAYEVNYQRPLFVQRNMMQPTPPVQTQSSLQREPLVFSIGSWDGQRFYLVLRDVAGEDMESGNLHTPAFQFFGNADAVFFMFDPLRVRAIRDQLQDLIPDQVVGSGDPRSVLNNVVMAIGGRRPRLAIILSKFDALRTLHEVDGSQWSLIMSNAGAAYLRDTSDSKRYDDGDGRLLHEEVRSLLDRLEAGSMLTAVENPASQLRLEHRYFVVSALGQPPTGQNLHSRGIAPFRCADPVRWVTSQFGVL
jgi:hypothetical protein